MLEIAAWLAIFAVSLAVLVKASGYFTGAAEKIGLLLGMSPFIVGVTLVSIGTSLPELISSILAVLEGSSEIVAGNVIGSNIANIFLVVGVAAVLSKDMLAIAYDLLKVDLPLFVGSAGLLSLAIADRYFSLGEAILCLAGFIIYLFYTIRGAESTEVEEDTEVEEGAEKKDAEREENAEDPLKKPIKRSRKGTKIFSQVSILIISSAFIFAGANYTVESIQKLSEIFQIGQEAIALSMLALGTSLPELSVTISIALKGNAEMAVGNVLGSNIFNSFVVMGIPGAIARLKIADRIVDQSLPAFLVATILFFFVTQDRRVTKWEGWLFFVFYAWFLGKTFDVF